VAQSSKGGVLDTSLEEWNRIMAINLTGYFLCIQHAGKMMIEQGHGSIINISAGSGERSSPGAAAYAVSKGAVNALTKQAAAGAEGARERYYFGTRRHADWTTGNGQPQAGV
jgi:NAD(P)-dependent dehydrogenase (short-subunit alcohol dehydrogenase family)